MEGVRVTQLMDKATATDLTGYLVQHADDRQAHKSPLTRGYKRLLDAYDQNRYLLVLVTDHLLVHGWPTQDEGISERMLTVGVFDYALREMGGTRQPWKFLYYRRFRETAEERNYFTFWLGRLEDARTAQPGTFPEPDSTWRQELDKAVYRLDQAVSAVRKRLEERGSLVEWAPLPPETSRPNVPGLEEFIHHPQRPNLSPRRTHGTSTG